MTKNAYIHIPFCKTKCHYCSFVSFYNLDLKAEYLKSLKRQILKDYRGEKLNTLYLGGGTPSLLSIDEVKSIIEIFNYECSPEITIEVNPDSVNSEYLKCLYKSGVNRISIGSQSFDDEILKLIGRRHNSAQIYSAVEQAKDAGFNNISLDLIYGLPNQNLNAFQIDLENVIKADVQHVSLYGLKIDEGCYFAKNEPFNIADSDIQADMYLKAIEVLEKKGFRHYEISNFAKEGFESRHNLNYWNNCSYYGFGCAASGYEDGIRYTNETDISSYITNPINKISSEKLSVQEILEEAIFLGFRKTEGINIFEINKTFEIDFNLKYEKIIKKYSDFLVKTDVGWTFNTKGFLLSNEILAEFIEN